MEEEGPATSGFEEEKPESPGFDAGYDAGFNTGFDQGYANGYQQGTSEHRAELGLDCNYYFLNFLPPYRVWVGGQTSELIRFALKEMRYPLKRLKEPGEVARDIKEALADQHPYSLIRLGDGEALTLAQEKVLSLEEVQIRGPFLAYAGVRVPDLKARDDLAWAIREASLVGLATSPSPNFWPLLEAALEANGLQVEKLQLTTSVMNYSLHMEGYLQEILLRNHPRTLLIGNRMPELAPIFHQYGVQVVGVVAPVNGPTDGDRVFEQARSIPHDLALISAGIAARTLAVRLAQDSGSVTLDFGHLADEIISGTKSFTPPGR